MAIRTQAVVPISGAADVALIDARKLDCSYALEAEHASLLLLAEVDAALRELAAGERVSSEALMRALADR